ncbi:MAG TPA: response regulator [Myxococcota bacterium]|nr:response regulator [Myxococcota bacterium]HRY94242.1 response regulator [Myxococcota bacterium]HSA24758.1 response regulator [Myxococcota bacterium]
MAGLRILVVDDDPVSRELLRVMLARLGYTCELAVDGGSALRSFRAQACELVLLDRQLPDLDGLEVARQLRGLPGGQAARVILVSGDPGGERPPGVDGSLAKPFTLEELSRAVRA